ncbi:fibulin-1-like [Lampris incognitus]|uniref:fibulin-1-like n=1 Tax=Lampris incognitus TaxID=2546036 RepID=UPI0024B49D0C|nr:fibulin-1-like [Lampris incognitus]
MEPLVVFLMSLYGLLHAQESSLPTMHDCCQDGREHATGGLDCQILPHISPSHICRIAQEQCCIATASDKRCTAGIDMGRTQGACERPFFSGEPWETKLSKMCCDCCLLGLIAVSQGLSCVQGLSLGGQCEHAAHICCGKTDIVETTPVPTTVKPATSLPVQRREMQRAAEYKKKLKNTVALSYNRQSVKSTCSQLCVGNGTCACHDGYQLKVDGVNCEDVNECLTSSHNCISGQVCINTEGSFRCQRETSCGTGYELTDHNKCQDIDECALGIHNCASEFVCNNTEGSFRCHPKQSCGDGFLQDAVGNCIDINECIALTSPCQPGQTCFNTVGSYTCRRTTVTCGRGYHLNEDGTRCEDVDECRAGNVCGDHGCINLVGSYRCECRVGFNFNSISRLCEDINECRHYPGRLCAHKCENTEGSYQCSCTIGFQLASDGRNCEDVNECKANPCSQECANVYGSYQCYCQRGYQLSDIDGITCEDIDECALPRRGHVCSYQCSNAPGSFYCTCPPTGYTLAPNGRTCQDIDECVAGSHTCSITESCFNVHGGYRCLSLQCPANFRQAVEGNDGSGLLRCAKACQLNDVGCALQPVQLITHTILSLPTLSELSAPEEIVFLRMMTPTNPAHHPGATDVFFDIVTADDQQSFDVVKRFHYDSITGIVRLVKPITGPRDIVVEVAMNYVKSGVFSHRNIIVIHIFISEFSF